jgi:hypothetical protein
MKRYLFGASTCVLFFLTACSSSQDAPPLPTVPLNDPSISAAKIQQTALSCQAEVDRLWQTRSDLPKEKIREFQISLGNASENCQQLSKFLEGLAEASAYERAFQQNIQVARSIGGGMSNSSPSNLPIQLQGQNAVSADDKFVDLPNQDSNTPLYFGDENSGNPLSQENAN